MNKDIKELLFISIEIISKLNELGKIETGENADYTDVISELKWNLMVLNNRLNDLRTK